MLEVMRRVWVQQYYRDGDDTHWRTKKKYGQPPANMMISSPHDLDIHYRVKRSTEWTGYKVHLTETCEKEHPRLITQVETTTSSVHDVKMTEKIQDDLAARNLKPEIQIVDQGYIEIDLLIKSHEKDIDLVGPVASGKSWQSKEEDAFDHTQFVIDWERQRATCPGGKTSHSFSARKTWRGTPNWQITFPRYDCFPCELRSQCTRSKHTGRTLTIFPKEKYEAQLAARQRQETEEFKQLYGERAGIEGTISQGVRKTGLRKSRYIGLQRTRLQHLATAAAINLFRIFDWLSGQRPAKTPVPAFVALAAS
jgi:transposase